MSKIINLEQNGRLFPNWVMKNFKKYILPEVILKEGDDPCLRSALSNKLTAWQEFISEFLNYRSPFKDALLYHLVGAGKTIAAIAVYNILFNYTPKWNVFLLTPAALHNDTWFVELNKWLIKENFENRLANIIFIHYDSPSADKDFLEKVRKADSSKQSIFIVDEAHRFINNVYNNISSKKGKRAQIIYDYIQQEKKENPTVRVMLLSATPVVNNPFELALIFNLLRPGSFPTSEAIFEQLYISTTSYQSLNENTKNMFQRRILGLVSYYVGATPDTFPSKQIHYEKIVMDKYQEEIYNHLEEIEERLEKLSRQMSRGKIGGDQMSTYNAYTRQACNFVFPHINAEISGESRPRPGKFRIKIEEAVKIDEGKDVKKINELKMGNKDVAGYIEAIKRFTDGFTNYLKKINDDDKINNYTLRDDIKTWREKYDSSFSDFLENEKTKSNLLLTLLKCGPKFVYCIFNILKSKGPVIVYSNYVDMEGLQIFKIYLNSFNFINFHNDSEINISSDFTITRKFDNFRYIEYHGSIDKDIRSKNKVLFNNKENVYGRLSKIIMISPAGAEGITMRNCRQVHIIEPFWNEARIEQVMGRAVRFCVHNELPMEERKVDIFRYRMVRKSGKETADEKLEGLSRKKNNLLISFLEAVREAAVDCELFKEHNMMGSKYNCFQFNEDSLFENPIGPAYNTKIEYDQKMDNGLNAKESSKIKIKVRKIKAVKQLEENMYSEPQFYWFYEPSGIVYDFDLFYPIGKIDKNDGNQAIKVDNETYVISNTIDIPDFKIY